MSRIVLVDEETGERVRHPLRTLKEADKHREWYERMTGRRFRVVKVFRSGIGAGWIGKKE